MSPNFGTNSAINKSLVSLLDCFHSSQFVLTLNYSKYPCTVYTVSRYPNYMKRRYINLSLAYFP